MDKKQFIKLIDHNKDQIFISSSPVALPFSFAVHTYFITNNKGEVHRWEVYDEKEKCETSWGYVHQNLLDPTEGNKKLPGILESSFKSGLVNMLEENGPIVPDMIDFIKTESKNYPFRDVYNKVWTPNSNTYTQWILNHFPESGLSLPWNAYGKGFSGLKEHLPNKQSQIQ